MQKTILYAVLNWGLGHATRSIPIIKHLLTLNYQVVIASDGDALSLLKAEFPTLIFEEVTAYDVVYASSSSQFNVKLASQIPKFIQAIKSEHTECLALCEKHQVDAIISDNRYGFYHKNKPSAFICHQLKLLYPDSRLAEIIINKSYQTYLKHFTQLWVPDLPPPNNISQDMSSLNWNNVFHLGIDSRLEKSKLKIKYNFLAILSGPEPQRSMMEKEVVKHLRKTPGKHFVVRGTDTESNMDYPKNIAVANIVKSDVLNTLLNQAEQVICRSGYTSVLDLLKLEKQAILVPTPGQAEQEYLAKSLSKKKWFTIQQQEDLNLLARLESQTPSLKFAYRQEIIQDFLSFPSS